VRGSRFPLPARGWPGPALLLYLLIFTTAYLQVALVPLLPDLATRYGLSPFGAAVLLVLPSASMMATTLPAGWLSDHFGPKPVTLAATAVMAASAVAHALPVYSALVVGRLLFGIAFGMVWTAALAWLARTAEAGHGDSGRSLGTSVTVGAVGSTVGPGVAGVLAQRLTLATPFALAAVVLAVVAVGLVPAPGYRDVRRRVSERDRGRQGRPNTGLGTAVAAALALVVSGAAGAVVQLLVPIQLHGSGASPALIGLILSSAAVFYIVASGAAVRLRVPLTGLRANALVSAAVGLTLLPGLLAPSLVAAFAVVALTAIPRAAIGTVAYALAIKGRAPATHGAVIGMLNMTWAAAQLAAPLAAGFANELFGPRRTYGVLAVIVGLTAAGLLAHAALARRADGEMLPSHDVDRLAPSAANPAGPARCDPV
jgi:predicted MFS family arabinose efflux permease